MSTFTDREEFLRRALRAAVDGIEPGADGLQRIQRRLGRPRPLALAWAEAAWTDILLRAPGGFQSAQEWVVRVAQLAWERFGPTTRTGGGRAARTMRWIRPLAALGVSVSIVAVGTYVALDAQQAIFPSTASSAQSSGGQPGSGGGVGGGAGSATTKSHSPVGGIIPFPGSTASRNCTSGKPSASPSPGIGSITPPSPTPSTSAAMAELIRPRRLRATQHPRTHRVRHRPRLPTAPLRRARRRLSAGPARQVPASPRSPGAARRRAAGGRLPGTLRWWGTRRRKRARRPRK